MKVIVVLQIAIFFYVPVILGYEMRFIGDGNLWMIVEHQSKERGSRSTNSDNKKRWFHEAVLKVLLKIVCIIANTEIHSFAAFFVL